MAGLIDSVLSFIYPPICAGCGRAEQVSALFCGTCEGKMTAIESAARCVRCSMPAGGPDQPCPHCRGRGLPPFVKVAALGVLGDPLKRVIHRGKYAGGWPLLELLAERLGQRFSTDPILTSADILVPVPLHRRRQIERGYNQAEVIARRLGRFHKIPVFNIADRRRPTAVQSQLSSRKKRVDNLRDAFTLHDARAVTGKRVVLVDDVLTTGSTLVYLARAIREAEPVSLAAMVLAVADPKGRSFEFI